jgi:DNA primase
MNNRGTGNPWVDFDTVKAAVSLEAVLEHYGVEKLRRRRRDQLEGCCPLHRGQREDAFHASLSKNVFHCFACGAKGNVLDFVVAMEQCSVREAALKLQAWFLPAAGTAVVGRAGQAGRWDQGELVREKLGVNPSLRFALTRVDNTHPYLAERGIEPATAAAFGVGFCAGTGLMQGRVVIPIHNPRGELVAYAGRAVKGERPKYRLPAGFRKGLELYNVHRAAATRSERVIVVEGYFDCLRVHQAGYRCVVGLMGCVLSEAQERLLLERFRTVLLMLDGDQAGRQASRAIAARLSNNCSVGVVRLPDGAQPDQLPPEVIRRLLECRNERKDSVNP